MTEMKSLLRQAIGSTRSGGALLEARRYLREQKLVKRTSDPGQYEFVNRSQGSDRLCILLAGYKEKLWDDVFGRLKAYLPEDFDVCILTSGLESVALKAICERNNWSYLSTKTNQLCHIQNLAIELHPKAQWILKLDEDIFVTEGFFESLFVTYNEVAENSFYVPAFISPILNVNCYSFLTLLQKTGLIDDFCNQEFGEIKLTDGLAHHRHILESPAIARYLWGDTQPALADIDALQREFLSEKPHYEICPYRFSIGCILFTRETWVRVGGFPVRSEPGLGDDEEHLGYHAFFSGRVIVVDTNCIVGHLGYGPQTKEMMQFYEEHRERFSLKG